MIKKLLRTLLPQAYIETYTGKLVNVFSIQPDDIYIEDIAHALSMQCRFSGHTKQFYSVAQHSCCCYELSTDYPFECLMHDCAEAYLHDVASPIKRWFFVYKWVEDRLLKVLAKKFHFAYPFPEEVHRIDKYMLHNEMCSLMHKQSDAFLFIEAWDHYESEQEFIRIFNLFKK
ncbi:phosphohydrolase [Limibacterium fermenti]|uniref:phosphohydrolase n=1 Tax=Limibacterium fermenti TaxID=3229863 RepID=UPI000E7D42E9|nr:metal-dependent phosphohydrolase [Porphyromonadaceae bacterium]